LTLARVVIILALAALMSGRPAAQTADGPDPTKVRLQLGPLSLNPTIALSNIGIDQNVFNQPADQNPQQDFTLTITPATEVWLRMGPTWVTGSVKEDIIWYQKFTTERAANNRSSIGWRVPLSRLNLAVNASHASVRDRPGFEIDARSQRGETSYDGKVEVRALARTFFGVTGSRAMVDYDKADVFLGTNLQVELNRTTTTAGILLREQLTPLTAIVLNATKSEDRFEFSSLRDSNSTAATATISFDPAALIKGSATFGYRDFEPLSPGVSSFKGTTANVGLTYVAFDATRLAFTFSRDVQYSYDINQPYFLQTGFAGSIAQQIFGPFDVIARGTTASMAYRNRAGAVVQFPDRVDQFQSYGGGIGYHMSRDLRLGVNVDNERRVSDVATRQYNNLKFGSAVTYGF
jgi:putative beta-barrel porin BBP2